MITKKRSVVRRTSVLLAFLTAVALILAPSLADARAGGGSSFGSRGSMTWSAPPSTRTAPNSGAPFERSMTPNNPSPGYAGAGAGFGGGLGRGSGFMSGLMGGLIGAGIAGMLFGHGFMGGGLGFGGFLGFLLQIFLLVVVVRFVIRWFARRSSPAFAGAPRLFARHRAPAASRPPRSRSSWVVGGFPCVPRGPPRRSSPAFAGAPGLFARNGA